MAIRSIVKFGARILHQVSPSVEPSFFSSPDLHTLICDLFETMYAYHGLGLAAPQIGVALRVAVVDVSLSGAGLANSRLVLINPKISGSSARARAFEGCLSLPGIEALISRPRSLDLTYFTPEGEERKLTARGLLARAICHEIDHLNGVLILSRMTPPDKRAAYKLIEEMRARGEWTEPLKVRKALDYDQS